MSPSFLVLAAVVAAVTLAFVLRPLARGGGPAAPPTPLPPEPAAGGEAPLAALEEIEFDRATGKLGEAEYAALRGRYATRAVEALARQGVAVPVAPDGSVDVAELAILAARRAADGCATCGPRPEPDARFCSACGRFLAAACPACGTAVPEADARYCSTCGQDLGTRALAG